MKTLIQHGFCHLLIWLSNTSNGMIKQFVNKCLFLFFLQLCAFCMFYMLLQFTCNGMIKQRCQQLHASVFINLKDSSFHCFVVIIFAQLSWVPQIKILHADST